MAMKGYQGIFLAVAIFAAVAYPVFGCTCGEKPPPEVALKGASAVFWGIPVEIRLDQTVVNIPSKPSMHVSSWNVKTKFRVTKAWKGVTDKWVWLRSPWQPGSCPLPLHVGFAYLVYARGGKDGLETTSCSRTANKNDAQGDLKALGPPGLEFPWTEGEKW
jgi:hypothetical protein